MPIVPPTEERETTGIRQRKIIELQIQSTGHVILHRLYYLEQNHHGTMFREEPKKSTIRTITKQQYRQR